jgi:hypothetical protein
MEFRCGKNSLSLWLIWGNSEYENEGWIAVYTPIFLRPFVPSALSTILLASFRDRLYPFHSHEFYFLILLDFLYYHRCPKPAIDLCRWHACLPYLSDKVRSINTTR